jgi:hypothetical protein
MNREWFRPFIVSLPIHYLSEEKNITEKRSWNVFPREKLIAMKGDTCYHDFASYHHSPCPALA